MVCGPGVRDQNADVGGLPSVPGWHSGGLVPGGRAISDIDRPSYDGR